MTIIYHWVLDLGKYVNTTKSRKSVYLCGFAGFEKSLMK